MPSLYGGLGQSSSPKVAKNPQPSFALPTDWMQQAATVTDPRAWHTLKAQINRAGQYGSGGQQALYSNPLAGQFDTETAGPRHGLFGRIKQATRTTPAFSQQGRLAMAKIAAFVLGAQALGTATAGAGAGAGASGAGAAGGGGLTAGQAAAAGVDPFLAGGGLAAGGAAGAAGGAGMAAAGGTPWYNTFGGQAAINAGSNLIGGQLASRAQAKSDSRNIDAMKDRIKLALQQLSPEQIQILVRQFLPQIAAINNPLQQTALQGLQTSQARQGLAGTPFASTAEAGLRGQFANNLSTQAFQQAIGMAGQRAGAVTGAPFVQTQPNMGLANAFSDTANQTLLAYALSRRQPQTQQAAPFILPGQATGWQGYEGSPYQWGFNPPRGY